MRNIEYYRYKLFIKKFYINRTDELWLQLGAYTIGKYWRNRLILLVGFLYYYTNETVEGVHYEKKP